jgi:hypothetical protein
MTDFIGLHSLDALALEKDVPARQGKILIDEVEDGGLTKDLSAVHLKAHTIHSH